MSHPQATTDPPEGTATGAKYERRLPPPGDPWRHVEVIVPRCPACSSRKVKATQGAKWIDEDGEQRAECRDCGARFILLLS